MARTQSTPSLSVFQIFNLCQKSVAAHKKCAGLLWKFEQGNAQQCLQDVLQCLQHVLLTPTVRQLAAAAPAWFATRRPLTEDSGDNL